MRPIGDWSMSITLSICSKPSIRSCSAGIFARAHDAARGRLVERLDQEGRLAAARNAGHRGEDAERNRGRDVLQIVAAGADDLDFLALLRLAPLGGNGNAEFAGQIFAGQRLRIGHDVLRRALRHDLAAVDAGGRADIDDIVGRHDRVLVMLDDDHRVADVAQMLQRFEQPGIVALVQADRRFVEHVEHAGQARADLRGQPDALAFAARQRAGIARQAQIFEADIVEEAQALADFLEDAHGDLVLLGVERLPAAPRTSRGQRGSTSRVTSPICSLSILTASASGFRRKPLQAGQGAADM